MTSPTENRLHNLAHDRLAPHGSTDLRAQMASVVDLDALEENRYEEVIESVDDRRSTAHYSLISMLVAGIYFGLLVGMWLVEFSSWQNILLWTIPVGLVTIYAVFASHQTLRELHHLSEARSILRILANQSPPK
ncbi:MAG: hypothetical protein R6T83_02545 [Salinibacter sp.]